MGDRAMCEIRTKEGSLIIYTRWGGHALPETARKAIIAAKGRWSDTPYAMRILVDQITKEGRDELTGFGLMLEPNAEDEHNNGKPSVIINLEELTLKVIHNRKEKVFTFKEIYDAVSV